MKNLLFVCIDEIISADKTICSVIMQVNEIIMKIKFSGFFKCNEGVSKYTVFSISTEKTSIYVSVKKMFHLSKFPSAALSSVDVAPATPSSSVLQSENLSCVKHTAIKGELY